MPSVTAATWCRGPLSRGLHCAAGLCPRPRRPRGAARGDDPRTRRALLGLVDQHRLSRERVRGRLLPRHRSRARCEASRRERDENSRALRQPWPLPTWPEVRTKYLLCREDRISPPSGHVATPASGSGLSPTRLTAATDVRLAQTAEDDPQHRVHVRHGSDRRPGVGAHPLLVEDDRGVVRPSSESTSGRASVGMKPAGARDAGEDREAPLRDVEADVAGLFSRAPLTRTAPHGDAWPFSLRPTSRARRCMPRRRA